MKLERQAFLLVAMCLVSSTPLRAVTVQVVCDAELSSPARRGVEKLCETLSRRGLEVERSESVEPSGRELVIVAGLASESMAALISGAGLDLPRRPESLAVRHIRDGERHTIVLCGADAVGLMYAALDTAERIG